VQNYYGPVDKQDQDRRDYFLRTLPPSAFLLPVLRYLIFDEALPLYNNTFRLIRAVETHFHLRDDPLWREARPFVNAGMAFAMCFDCINHEFGNTDFAKPLLI
jgi:hypothetical protein